MQYCQLELRLFLPFRYLSIKYPVSIGDGALNFSYEQLCAIKKFKELQYQIQYVYYEQNISDAK